MIPVARDVEVGEEYQHEDGDHLRVIAVERDGHLVRIHYQWIRRTRFGGSSDNWPADQQWPGPNWRRVPHLIDELPI